MKGWAIGEGRGKGDCQRARSSGDEKALLGARKLFQRFTMASAVLSVSATAAQARPSAARRAVQAKAAGRCGRGSRIGLRHPSCMLGLARVGPRPLPPPLPAARCHSRPRPLRPRPPPRRSSNLWTPQPRGLTSQRGVEFSDRLAPEAVVYAGQGPPPPSPLVVERFQQVISQLFTQVRRGLGGCWGAAGGEQRAGGGRTASCSSPHGFCGAEPCLAAAGGLSATAARSAAWAHMADRQQASAGCSLQQPRLLPATAAAGSKAAGAARQAPPAAC